MLLIYLLLFQQAFDSAMQLCEFTSLIPLRVIEVCSRICSLLPIIQVQIY